MICEQDPLRRRPRKSTARQKTMGEVRLDGEKFGQWPSKRGPIAKIRRSDGCGRNAVPLAVGKQYKLHILGWNLGNVSLIFETYKVGE